MVATETEHKSAAAPVLWSTVLGLVAVLGSYGLACIFPFAAIAAIAAMTMPSRQAVAVTGAVLAVNQIIGFMALGYPHDGQALAWGLVIGVAAFAALAAATRIYGHETRLMSLRSAAALAASILAYQAIMFLGAVALDGFESSTPDIVATVARHDVMWFAGLVVLRAVLGLGLPRWFGSAQLFRTA